jgi:hypothetical protein
MSELRWVHDVSESRCFFGDELMQTTSLALDGRWSTPYPGMYCKQFDQARTITEGFVEIQLLRRTKEEPNGNQA